MTLLRTQRASRMRSLHVIRERKRDLTRALSRTLIRSCVYYWDNKEKEKYVESKSPIKLPIYKFLDSTWNDIITSTRQPRDMNRLILCREKRSFFSSSFAPCSHVIVCEWGVRARRRELYELSIDDDLCTRLLLRESKNETQQNARVKYSTLWDKISTAKTASRRQQNVWEQDSSLEQAKSSVWEYVSLWLGVEL